MLRSGKELQVVPQPKPNPTDTESKPDADSRVQQQAKHAPLPFPSWSLLARKPETDEDLLKIFRQVEINILLFDAIKIFSIPCTIGGCTFADAMLDLEASINVMSTSVYKSLNFGDLEPTSVVIQLANRSVVQPVGILEDVLVQVNKLIFPADFYVLDMEDEISEKGCTLILGRPFLMTARTKIDFKYFQSNEASPEDHSLCSIDMIEELVEEFTQLDSDSSITEEADFINRIGVLDPFDFGNHVNNPDN
ncbi:hypothetical protein CR513_15283, partial [Mucuna pruriens]